MKCAVYVEGKAEMLFVADILSKYYNYNADDVGFRCVNLNADSFEFVSNPQLGDENISSRFYQIVNVNNDNLVVSKLKKDIPSLKQKGFDVIIGLRDVYGENYCNLSKTQTVNYELISKMHIAQYTSLGIEDSNIRLHFAVMEYEAWMMALLDKFIIERGGDPKSIFDTIGISYESDFENAVYHPYNKVQKIFDAVNCHYGKHERDQFSFLSSLEKSDYEKLRNSHRCSSFKTFVDSLLSI